VARVTTGDWDAVIMTRTAFERIAMSPTAQADYLDAQLSELREALERQRSEGQQGRRNTLKQLETRLLNAEEKIKERLAKDYDPAVTFEQTGIDYVVVDEAHDFKNLHTASRIPGAAIEGSNRAADLEMKMHYLRRRHGLRVGTFATATPIANSITEAHVMQRYLRPDLLEAAGVLDFDTWAATFGQTTAEIEIGPDGGTPRLKARFAKFHNSNEMRERAKRMVREARQQEPGLSVNAACKRIGPQLGIVPDTLRGWCKQADIDDGLAPGVSTAESEGAQAAAA